MPLHASAPLIEAHRPEPTDPPNPHEPDTVPDPTREPVEPSAPPIGDPPPQPNQAPQVLCGIPRGFSCGAAAHMTF